MDLLARLFVEPAPAEHDVRWVPPAEPARPASAVRPRRVAVVCAPRDARVAGGAAALSLGASGELPLVLEWGSEGDRTARPATPTARRAAAALQEAGEAAVAGGRLVRVALPDDEEDAAASARSVIRQATEPTVLVVARPRGAAMEQALGEQDVILLAVRPGDDEELTALARESLQRLAPCELIQLPASPGAAALARSGTALVAPLRAPFRAALGTSPAGEVGQALFPLMAGLLVVVLCAIVAGAIAHGLGERADSQRAADLGALSGARAMRAVYDRLFEPPLIDGRPNPAHLERAAYLALGARSAREIAEKNGAEEISVSFPAADAVAPTRIRVAVGDAVAVKGGGEVEPRVAAEAQLAPPASAAVPSAGQGEYPGPYAYRQGKPMRPDTAQAFDRLAEAASADGVSLIVVSGYRSNAEQAVLWARHPDPKWVARPGTSLHRLGTELDLGPSSAYPWLYANAPRFHFIKRYAWEPWHFGYVLNAGTASVGYGASAAEARSVGVPDFVPAQFVPAFAAAAQRWNVSATLLAAQAYKESGFNPMARSPAGAQGIAQFMPGTAAAYGLDDPFDATQAIDAQAHMMRDLLRQFASVPLALAAYNAGSGRVGACMCIPPIPETQAYVAAILGMLNGMGDSAGLLSGGLEIRLVQ
ncbi:MAG: transglycosylase SLT domain-containing protein [Solirubrobacteraceae bacterium]